jgi:hypothetical protein
MVEGRSKQAFKFWLADRPRARRDDVEVVAMGRFYGFKTATAEELPDAVAVMDPVTSCACRRCLGRLPASVQQELHGHRGRTGDPLYAAQRTLHTGVGCSPRSRTDLRCLFAADEHIEVEVTC